MFYNELMLVSLCLDHLICTGFGLVWFGLSCLMTLTILFLKLQITRPDIRSHMKWAVSLVIAYGHFKGGYTGKMQ